MFTPIIPRDPANPSPPNLDNTPNALTDNKPWDYETPELIQQRKDYLAGKAAPPIEDIVESCISVLDASS